MTCERCGDGLEEGHECFGCGRTGKQNFEVELLASKTEIVEADNREEALKEAEKVAHFEPREIEIHRIEEVEE